MQLEDYFDFIDEPVETIRIRGTRIDIEFVIRLHLEEMIPEQILVYYGGALNLERVYATITYYLHNKARLEDYLSRSEETSQANHQNYLNEPGTLLRNKLREWKQAQVYVESL
jgi:uncharacterized protein (DUF433 family)